jgi:hypothetical protein
VDDVGYFGKNNNTFPSQYTQVKKKKEANRTFTAPDFKWGGTAPAPSAADEIVWSSFWLVVYL